MIASTCISSSFYFKCLLTLLLTPADVNWGSSTQGATYVSALKHAQDLQYVEEHVKNYRPQILVLSGRPMTRPPLLDFANLISKNTAFMACGQIAKVCNGSEEKETTIFYSY